MIISDAQRVYNKMEQEIRSPPPAEYIETNTETRVKNSYSSFCLPLFNVRHRIEEIILCQPAPCWEAR